MRDFFVHFETLFGVCNRARLFSALFGHAVADEYANVRRDGDADCMLCTHRSKLTVTDYKPHAACCTGCERRQYITHTPTTGDINQPHRTQSVYTSTNESLRAIDSDVYEVIRWWTYHYKKKKNVVCSSQISFFSEMIYFIIYQHRLLSVTF